MKQTSRIHQLLPAALAGLVLGATSLWAANPIVVDTFDSESETNAWTLLDPADGALYWDNTEDAGGTGAKGSLKVVLLGSAGATQIQPQVNLGTKTFNSGVYYSLSFDVKVDPASSWNGSDYGHIQAVLRNSAMSWEGINWTLMDSSYTNWTHMDVGFVATAQNPYDTIQYLVFQVQGVYLGDVVIYLDNIQINPAPFTYFFNQFTNSDEAAQWSWANWSQPGSLQWVTSPDAGGATPAGSLQISNAFLDNPSNYQQVVFSKNVNFDPSRFTYLDLDVRLDPNSFPSADDAGYGDFSVILEGMPNYFWATLGTHTLTGADSNNWVHLSFPMGGMGLTNVDKLILKVGRGWSDASGGHGMTNTVIYYVDNIKVWTPQSSPTVSLRKSGPGGLEFDFTNPNDQWTRQGIVTPSYARYFGWYNAGAPVSYSFTITNYSPAAANPGFEAHVYLVNYDTLVNPQNDETASAVDWNAADIMSAKIQNNASGGVDFSFNFKTNLPAANINQTVASLHAESALGTWTLTFNDNTSGTMTTPDGTSTNFSISPDVAARFSGQMVLHFGTFKNNFVNNNASATFSQVQVTGGSYPFVDTFPGPGLNSDPLNPFWRVAGDPNGIVWIPAGTAWWLDWTLPDTGFTAQSAPSVTGPWTSAGITYILQGTTRNSGAVPQSEMPAGSSAYFRLVKPPTP